MSKIEWTEITWNPVTGCTKISPGCKHCYAETMAHRLQAMGTPGYEGGFALSLQPARLQEPMNRKKPTTYFVNSMSDLFHEKVPDEYIQRIFGVMWNCPQHTFQCLTKRADRLARFGTARGLYEFPQNAWIGVSVEDREYGLPRIDELRKVNASVRFLSVEPLLEDLGQIDLAGIHWVIVGGESGTKARPMQADWVRSIRDQCKAANVPFFFKQWGGMNKKTAGRLLDGELHDEYPL
jgi:protein gp37